MKTTVFVLLIGLVVANAMQLLSIDDEEWNELKSFGQYL